MNLIFKPLQQIESRKKCQLKVRYNSPFLSYLDKIFILLKFSILTWACNLDATLDAPPGGGTGGAVYLQMRYTL